MQDSRWIRTLTAISCAYLMVACNERMLPVAEPSPLVSVKVSIRPHLSYAPLIIAEEEGYFSEEGIAVEMIDLWTADAMIALSSGEIDVVGQPLFVGLFNAMARGAPIRIVADKGHVDSGCSPYTLMAREGLFDRGPLTIDDARGLKLERREGTVFDFVVEHFVEQNGFTFDDFERVEYIVPSSSPAAFASDQVDLKIETEPNQTFLVESGLARPWIPLNDIVPDLQFSVIVFGQRLTDELPEAGSKFMTAYLRGVRTYSQGPTESNIDTISRFTNLETDLVRKACWAPIHDDGRVNADQVQDFVDWVHKRGFLERALGEEDWWDPRFVADATAELQRRENSEK